MEEKETKTVGEELKEKLFYEQKNAFSVLKKEEIEKVYAYCDSYIGFLRDVKTEREAVKFTEELLKKEGFVPFEYGKKYSAGDKIYLNNRGKAIYIIVVGSDSLDEGVSIAAAHIDSPRIDLKQHPLYESAGMAFFKTHYYGGIKTYQWTTIPLALHGTVVKKDGTSVDICIGEKDSDPVFCITDLLPHLGRDQATKPLGKAIAAEGLNLLVGSRPFDDEKLSIGDAIKLNVLSYLYENYGIDESDFLSAELYLVPAEKPRELGFDRSMILSYGHDDRVCAYPIVTATLEAYKLNPQKTIVTILADKEETGSDGPTGMQSYAFENLLAELAEATGANYRRMMANSKCLSADVTACYDPNYAEVYEPLNSAYINKGVALSKFTGGGGKSHTNDASAEYVAEIRNIFDNNDVMWQMAELGKVDQGGGGTVAMFISELNVDTIDVGVPVLSMHAPFEAVSKVDVYMTHKAVKSFFLR